MTFILPGWAQVVFNLATLLIVLFLLNSLHTFLTKKIEKKWLERLISLGLGVVAIMSIFALHNSYDSFSVMSNDLIITGEGEVKDVGEKDAWLLTTDDDLVVFSNDPLFIREEFRFKTKDHESIRFNLQHTSKEYEVEALQSMAVKFADAISEERPKGLPLYLSFYSYYDEVMKEEWQKKLSAEVRKYRKSELSTEKLQLIVNEILVSMDEYEDMMFEVEVLD
ncbi:hypothetical protein B4U37_13805 [Sutcliffiella horikoshii]|uniref:Uncharacterized protein n=1 Tax=Sutcliffiella horikoshii TaxID=79883 RepID=A0ABN4ZKS8_9BACI|nr:hypothetical protein [Sutcliffiella horikoshii]ART77057.1 hypothetical protein B4U37_13805 [Sutcliffiella horikoshii]